MSNDGFHAYSHIENCHKKSLTSGEYAIGIIAVLNIESAIAKAILDEEHEKPSDFEQQQSDDNVYTWGRAGKHNVVLASLASGSYGMTSAATTAKAMVMSIPSIHIGLLVGIGGGIPCPHRTRDIRLGDVAVSSPTGSSGGVAQYDLGKQKLNTYERVGFLAQPPNVLLKALTVVSANRMAGSSKLPRILLGLQRNLENSAGFAYPGRENDWLFSASFEHRGGNGCDECQISGSPNMANQSTRLSNEPEVHYGIIASGNTVMKNAKHRDELALALKDRTGGDCICYEMEAAGVMNDFPCLVIRGISNYADSHKNDRWQRYAAMTAVAYAKELLSVVPVRRGTKGKKTVQVNNGPGSSFDTRHNENQRYIQHWLGSPDPSVNHKKALRQRHKDSGLWLLLGNAFIEWRTRSNSFLWLHGIPGCGKTILSSTIIEDLSNNITQSRIIFFYFDFNDIDKQTVHGMICSLVTQLYIKQIKARSPLDSLFSSCDNGKRQPTTENLCAAFLQMLEAVDQMWIVLDALDECQTRKGSWTEGLLSWIKNLVISKPSNIHILVTSRQLEDIESAFMSWASAKSNLSIQRDEVNNDIRGYIHSQIHEDDGLKRWRSRSDVQQEIETRLMEKADGMFRWVACQIDALRDCLDYRSLTNALTSLPKTLCDTYDRTLADIPRMYRETAIRLLQFLVFSERPLRIEEAVDAIAVDLGRDAAFDPRNRMPEPTEISRYCPGLVVIVPQKSEPDESTVMLIQLAHSSVKDYLLSERLYDEFGRHFRKVVAHASITKICLAYMSSVESHINTNPLSMRLKKPNIKRSFPLGDFVGRYWEYHARHAENERDVQEIILSFLLQEGHGFAVWMNVFCRDPFAVDFKNRPAPPLCHASSANLPVTVKLLLERGADVNAQGPGGSALQEASYSNRKSIVQLLLQSETDVNLPCGRYGSAIQSACMRGNQEIVQLLLAKGAYVNLEDPLGGSALIHASDRGDKEIVLLLLEHGADVNMVSGLYGTALQKASSGGHISVVQLLLENEADVNIGGGLFDSPLHEAAFHGHMDIVHQLLKHGANIDQVDKLYGSPLQTASSRNHNDIVQMMLEHGADINKLGGLHGSALQTACFRSHLNTVQLLLKHGADVNVWDHAFDSPLRTAVRHGHEDIVHLLLGDGADDDRSLASEASEER